MIIAWMIFFTLSTVICICWLNVIYSEIFIELYYDSRRYERLYEEERKKNEQK
jgi:hypothetical protein